MKVVVCDWQFFMDHGLRAGVVEALHLEIGPLVFYSWMGVPLSLNPWSGIAIVDNSQ